MKGIQRTKRVTSLKTFIDIIMQLKANPKCEEYPTYQWFFRGQKDRTWSVEPSVFRNDGIHKEYALIQSALRQNPFDFRDYKTHFEILTKLQHYGLGTRLLDVTLNPLVALYFASEEQIEYKENKNGQYTRVEQDGIVFVKFSPWYAPDNLATRIAAAIPFLDFREGYSVGDFLDDLINHGVVSAQEAEMLRSNNYHLLIEYIQNSYFVLSSHSNERLIRQSGGFVLPTFLIIQSFDAPVNETSLLSKAHCNMSELFDTEILIIPAKDKCAIREELDFFNINEATLFPELEHQMAYIKQKSVPTNGIVPTFKKYVKQMEIFSETVSNVNPDLEKIIKTQFADLSIPIQEILIDEIGTQLALIDWKQKTSIKSQIRSTAKRIIQQELSAIESNYRAEKLLEILLNPTDEFAKNEVTI